MEESKKVLHAIHAALKRQEWDVGFNYKKGLSDFRSPPLLPLKRVSQILSTAGACHLLYSGEDSQDDGGDSTLANGKLRFTRIWDGKDAVWPSLASPEEASKALWRK
jgi:hypothetical protein